MNTLEKLPFEQTRVSIRPGVMIETIASVSSFRDETSLSDSDRKELTFWETDPGEGPGADLFENVIYKSKTMLTFRRAMKFMKMNGGERVLELGSGQGWASVMLKKKFPTCYVAASDVSPYALDMSSRYESLIGANIDEKWACGASSMPFADDSFDVVFCFAAFHHFIIGDRYEGTLREMLRVLRPGGRIILLYEPSSPPLLYKLAAMRVNKNRAHSAEIDEDVLQLVSLAEKVRSMGARFSFTYFPDAEGRNSVAATFYYWLLGKVAFLRGMLPCTVNVQIDKA